MAIGLVAANEVNLSQPEEKKTIKIGVVRLEDPYFYLDCFGPTMEFLREKHKDWKILTEEIPMETTAPELADKDFDFLISPSGFFEANLKEAGLVNYETYGTIELTEQGEDLAKKIIEAYDIVYLFLKDVLNIDSENAEKEAEEIKSSITDDTLNKLAKYVHKVLGLSNLNCNYDINKEKCRSCAKRKPGKINE